MLKRILFITSLFLIIFLLAWGQTSTWTAVAQTGDETPSDYTGGSILNFRAIIQAATASTSGTEIRIKILAHSGGNTIIHGTAIAPRDGASEDYDETPVRITWDSGGSGTTITADNSKWSDWMDVSEAWVAGKFDEAVDHLVHVYQSGGIYAQNWQDPDMSYWTTSGDSTLTEDYAGTLVNRIIIEEIEVRTVEASEEDSMFFGINFLEVLW